MVTRVLAAVVIGMAIFSGTPGNAQVVTTPISVGTPMPAFQLKGTDGKTHSAADWKGRRVLAVAFICNHCTESQLYEKRLNQLTQDYAAQGVTVIAIQSSNPKAFTDDDLAWSDVGESLEDMKERAALGKFSFPYLYDGDTGSTAIAFGAKVAPSIYIFDQDRKLRYSGKIDDNPAGGPTTKGEAVAAIEALLAGAPVTMSATEAKGCALRLGADKAVPVKEDHGSVDLSPATTDVLSKLRHNPTGKLLMVNFYATWCGPCVAEFPELLATDRMYRSRGFSLTTVSSNTPDEKPEVMKFLESMHATTSNLLYASDDVYAMQEAFDPNVGSAVPVTVLLGPNGELLLDQKGEIDLIELRRGVLANLPDDANHVGAQQYWVATLAQQP
jgi:thiol-disulfide isomerase/thioredoxin